MRFGVERADGELVVRGEEHHRGHPLGRPPADDFEAVDLRHLDVEEDHVRPERVEGVEHLAPVAAFTDDGEFREGGEQLPHATAGGRLVVGDEHAPLTRIASALRLQVTVSR